MIKKPVLEITLVLTIVITLIIFYPIQNLSFSTEYGKATVSKTKSHEREVVSSVKGVYALMNVNGTVDPELLSLPYVEGISIRARWSLLEPEYKKYNWEYIDNILKQVRGTGKNVMIRVLPGVSSPSWIYKKGALKVEFAPHRERKRLKFGEKVTAPLMWDPIYISLWNEFVDELAKKYGEHSSIVMVHMAGPTVYSAEMHLLKSKDGKKLLQNTGYSRKKVFYAWKTVIDNFSGKFMKIKLSLNIALPLRKDGTLEEVMDYAVKELGMRLSVQGNWLKSKTTAGFLPYLLLSELNENRKDIEIGFQMARSSRNNIAAQGTLETAVNKGIDVNAKYFELYQVDILDINNKEYLIKLNDKLVKGN